MHRSWKLDIQDIQQNRAYSAYGLRRRYATQTLETSFLNSMARSGMSLPQVLKKHLPSTLQVLI
jgi:hypothetical protein